MRLFIALSFVLLAALYWVASGGLGFEPEAWPRQTASAGSASDASGDGLGDAPATAPAGALDVPATRAEPPTSELVAPPPEPGVLTLEPPAADEAVAAAETAAEPATEPAVGTIPGTAPAAGPEGLPDTPVAPDEALAALAPDLAAPPAPEVAARPAPVEAAPPAPATRREVAGDRVNLREGPGTTFDVVGRLARGEAAEVIESRDGWARVRVGANEGWVSERFLAP